ncbi:GNAT family N-acetyltransferase [Phyllobacterium myrsinacearum]|uniref:Putative N-acetyltransferase YhbS n=1 Tax=Phyllobacterium myrsinacearum TaxID=28101 RepID=A0A839EL98_9HYPH|nr:GNAT family N-acetyltransferase [Phyllobacterium myrsinacearum]MBA8879599.1 putative N-acetyltransferase YhbS [Phyllobacterium myrsinacearum]
MHATQIELVEFTKDHLDGALALSRQAKWPHRREDWTMVLDLSTGVVALDRGRVVGTTLVTQFGQRAASINMVIVDEAMRGRGIGRRLMDFALQQSDGLECRLVATQDGLPLYEKLGFRVTGKVKQYQGIATGTSPNPDVSWATGDDAMEFVRMDQVASGLDRTRLMTFLGRNARIAVLRREGRMIGFAALRTFGRGEVIGPVVAMNVEDACQLLAFLFAERAGTFLRVDIPEAAGLAPWLNEHGLAQVGGGIAMRRGAAILDHMSAFHTFALASQALG